MCVTTPPCRFERFSLDGKAVILAGDLDTAGVKVLHRLIPAAMTELQLVCRCAHRQPEQLVAEADAEDRHLAQRFAQGFDGVIHRGRIAGAVADEQAVGLEFENLARPSFRAAKP